MTIQTITAQFEKTLSKQVGSSVDVSILASGLIICCTREAAKAVKGVMAMVANVKLELEHDWQDDPDFAEMPIQLNYSNV